MSSDLFHRLPPPTALLLLATLFDLTAAHALRATPRPTANPTLLSPTTTIPLHALDVVSWPLVPTAPPRNPHDLHDLRRRQDPTICGYIGGISALPATCSAGSHCVLDQAHGVIGCCPDGQDNSCLSGVYTGCVDANSGPQTVVNPYVYTCTGSNVCYKNLFAGGFSQFGCGTASNLGTTVLPGASGVTGTLTHPSVSVAFTQSPSTLSNPTTLGTLTSPRPPLASSTSTDSTSGASSTPSASGASSSTIPTSSQATATSSSQSLRTSSTTVVTVFPPSSTESSTSTTSSSSTTALETNDPPAAPSISAVPSTNRTGAIVGGTISGVAVAIAAVALGIYLLRRRRADNTRRGPGDGAKGKYISRPSPVPSSGFSPVDQDSSDAFETAALPPVAGASSPFSSDLSAGGPSPFAYMGAAGVHTSYPPQEGYHYPARAPSSQYTASALYTGTAAAAGGGGPNGTNGRESSSTTGVSRGMESDQVPLTREIDDFSHGFQAALGRIGEEDEGGTNHNPHRNGHGDLAVNDGNGIHAGAGISGYRGPSNMRPLWQQNRRQSRNLMWM